MATYTEEVIYDQINSKDTGHVECRQATRVLKDGVVISTTYHRHVCVPDSDMTHEDPRVVAIAAASWTPEVIAAYEAAQDAAAAERQNQGN